MTMDQSRRAFLKRASMLSMAGGAAPFVMNLAAMGEAAAATASDYKALVCVFLFGGNDYANTLVPYDSTQYGVYRTQRAGLALAQSVLDPTVLRPSIPLASGAQYALTPGLAKLLPIFDAGKMAVMLNVGTLVQPTTKAQYNARSVPLPPKLLSHNDQQNYWQASGPEGATSGWGGRIGDLLQSGNGTSTLTCINVSGNAVFLTGKAAVQYSITNSGPIGLTARTSLNGSAAASTLLQSLIGGSVAGNHQFGTALGTIGSRALGLYTQVTGALAQAPTIATPFPAAADPSSSLGAQLQTVARLIAVSQQLGAKRQVFFVSTGRYDTHDGLGTLHPTLMTNLGDALRAFYDTTVELGVANQVTTFTASDFGRALTANNDGSDHGWGSMHFVLGGAVRGGRYYGINPTLANGGPDDIGQGRLIPTMSVDQYAATLASWFGVAASDLATVVPNIGNFAGSALGTNVGFV
ncbi:DUF1501 domain-containing protein [Novosphingobium flavum]|uniref:DUF1501 domain-containing protein n=1 Tax=Novosphingobium aerophilum TaxID=2839843 RepID=UPI00163A2112|nr:DUF1501 domain-containing protein [Novosphingobium aerophilum]MBC2660273.1 DUF1501 domain-containing protein [Novosphingobium aerophilum]